MAIAEAAKIVFQTGLAGTLEELGFRKVSETNYLREAEGIEWRVVFGPEFPGETGTFCDATGYYLPEVDRLYRDIYPDRPAPSQSMARTRYRETASQCLAAAKELYEPKFNPNFVPLNKIDSCCYDFRERGRFRMFWDVSGKDPVALGQRIHTYWNTYMLPWYRQVDTIEKACAPGFPITEALVWKTLVAERVLQWWVGGYKDEVRDWLEIQEMKRHLTDEDIRGRFIELYREKHSIPFLWRFYKPTRQDISGMRDLDLRNISAARKVQEVLGLGEIVKSPD